MLTLHDFAPFYGLLDANQSDFWNELTEMKIDNSKEYPLDFEIEFNSFEKVFNEFSKLRKLNNNRLSLQQKVVLTRRLENENALLKQWFENTPKENFPELSKEYQLTKEHMIYSKKTPSDRERQIPRQKILNFDFKYFIPMGNRYPGDPNAPETWQGWQELEESITPSTMRDEIRLTRICIQYCDTRDEKVLNEIKEWFADMNEIQRICMAKSILVRMGLCNEFGASDEAKSLIPPYQDLYKTIQEYDVTAKTDDGIAWLKKLELIE